MCGTSKIAPHELDALVQLVVAMFEVFQNRCHVFQISDLKSQISNLRCRGLTKLEKRNSSTRNLDLPVASAALPKPRLPFQPQTVDFRLFAAPTNIPAATTTHNHGSQSPQRTYGVTSLRKP